jgi:sRNA-binding regulator protein Hfq
VNRKLIRTTLAEVKERELQAREARRAPEPSRDRGDRDRGDRDRGDRDRGDRGDRGDREPLHQPRESQSGQPSQPKKKIPPEQTNAESFYYKKQMDSHTPMVIILQDNERLAGTIEWYDKNSIKLHRLDGPNLLILKHNIKYMYKDQKDDDEKED